MFVTDIGRAICACIERLDISAGQAYNLSAPEVVTYKTFIEILREVSDRPFETYAVTVEEVLEKNIPLPFPLTAQESERYIGDKICRDLGTEYSPLRVGMQKAFNAFRSVYER